MTHVQSSALVPSASVFFECRQHNSNWLCAVTVQTGMMFPCWIAVVVVEIFIYSAFAFSSVHRSTCSLTECYTLSLWFYFFSSVQCDFCLMMWHYRYSLSLILGSDFPFKKKQLDTHTETNDRPNEKKTGFCRLSDSSRLTPAFTQPATVLTLSL